MENLPSDNKIFKLPKNSKFDAKLLPALQNLKALGYSASSIGMILGYAGKNSRDWLKNLAHRCPEVREALKVGEDMSKMYLVKRMYDAAVGYEYQEEEKVYEEGELVKTVKKTKERPGSAKMAMFLACNKMPEDFVNKVELSKKNINISLEGELSSDKIKEWAGRLACIDAEKIEDSK